MMIESKTPWKSVRDKEKWAARGATFMAKAKATKMVWFPPHPVETGKKAASTTKRATNKATKKTAGAARRTTTGAGKTTAGAAKKVTNPVRRKKV